MYALTERQFQGIIYIDPYHYRKGDSGVSEIHNQGKAQTNRNQAIDEDQHSLYITAIWRHLPLSLCTLRSRSGRKYCYVEDEHGVFILYSRNMLTITDLAIASTI